MSSLQETTMLKTANICQISDLPEYIDVKFAIEQSTNEIDTTKEEKKFILQVAESVLGYEKRSELLIPAVEDQCKDIIAVKNFNFGITASQFEDFKNGELIASTVNISSRNCLTV